MGPTTTSAKTALLVAMALAMALGMALGTGTSAAATTPSSADLLIAGEDNGRRADQIRMQVDEAAAGQTVVLHVIRGTKAKGNKRLVPVSEAVVPEDGQLTFEVDDRNKNRRTRYLGKITVDGSTFKSNTQKLR